jgi:hypothetical protein
VVLALADHEAVVAGGEAGVSAAGVVGGQEQGLAGRGVTGIGRRPAAARMAAMAMTAGRSSRRGRCDAVRRDHSVPPVMSLANDCGSGGTIRPR